MSINAEQIIDEINQKITPDSLPVELHKEVNITVSEILKLKHDHSFEAKSLVEDVADIIELMRNRKKYKFIGGKHSIISTMLAPETPDIDIMTPVDLDSTLNLILPKGDGVDRVIFDQCDFALKRIFASSLIGMGRPSNLVLLNEDGTEEPFQNPGYTILENGEIIIDIESFRSTVLGAISAQGSRQRFHDPNFIKAIRQLAKLGGENLENTNLIH